MQNGDIIKIVYIITGELEKTKAVEYIYNQDICPNIISGIRSKRFSINDCIDSSTGTLNLEKLKDIFNK